MKRCIDNEKNVLKYRVNMVKVWAEMRMKEIKASYNKLYERLQDFIRVSIKAEREAIAQLSLVLREPIESEGKIQQEVRMKTIDLYRDERFLYYIVPPPKPLPAIEIGQPERFTIVQIRRLIDDVKMIMEPNGRVETGLLISLFSKKVVFPL